MADEFDPFAGSSGLPDDFNCIVKEAWFAYDPDYQNGQVPQAYWTVETDDEDFGDHGVGELRMSIGNGWEVAEGGAAVVRENGDNKMFNRSTVYQMFIGEAIKLDGAEKVLRSEGRGDPRKAAMWVGTAWHLKAKEINYGGEIGKRDRLMPDKFLGVGTTLQSVLSGGGATPAKAAAKAAPAPAKAVAKKAAAPVAKAAAPVAEAAASNGAGGLTEGSPVWDELYALAMAADTHEAFVEAAFTNVAGVDGDDALQQAVMDSGEGSLWARVVADYEAANA